jgi:periplasmic divalent cation tolerance protein
MLKCENCNAFMQKALQKSIMVGISTFPRKEDALRMLESLLNHKLIACGQISSPIESIYLWKNQIKKEIEWKMTIKFPIENQSRVTTTIKESHPYENPQWIVSEMVTTDEYYQWVLGNCP